ncbi:sigma-70 family RNA polymerase sigma factor [Myxococcus sp. K15C18031901]|uniref:sigma-70 family RNA polymerase sigma factor n=1 Tax=Myxococcus dinghuensis TaxID=2906761 RepID=UPI0020A769DF|nr:sigma-70 family RNA polymerase sigma factor [Myxococcus dinghuensis]MCP3097997.1 sigma-70 family RNA polymerase sigma factor [Myxococcus dinghuensis]
MDERDWRAERFEEHRAHLRSVAFRMLGSRSEAEDAVQEAWFRLSRADARGVDNLGGWLTTVVSRVCLDMLRSRKARREEHLGLQVPEPLLREAGVGPPPVEREVELADSVGAALLVVLETMAPAERLAFVLHDLFAVPFEQISHILGRTPEAVRQLASRGRRRLQGEAPAPEVEEGAQRVLVSAFLTAAREGNFEALLSVLAPDVVLRADSAAVLSGAPAELRGADAVARMFNGGARGARLARVDGVVGVMWSPGGGPLRGVIHLTMEAGRIRALELVGDRAQLERFILEPLE